MSNACVVLSHSSLNKTVTMEIVRELLTAARFSKNAQTRIVMMFKDRYEQEHRARLGFVTWNGLRIKETADSMQRPQGCSCECVGCESSYHCANANRGCHF